MLNTDTTPFATREQNMAAEINAFDWSATSLNDRSAWPASLKTLVNICIQSVNPVLILWTNDFIQIYNDAYRDLIGDKSKIALGQVSRETWADSWQSIEPILNSVWEEGKPLHMENQMFQINRHGYMENAYFTTSYIPVHDESGKMNGIFVTSQETTLKVETDKRLLETENQVHNVFLQAPMGIATLKGMDMRITLANADILNLWRKKDNIIGQPLLEALPEIKDQGFLELLQNVYTTGKPFYAYERLAHLMDGDELKDFYFDFVYAPIKENNKVTGVIAVATEVTAQVLAKQELEQSEKRFRSLIIEAPMATALYVGREMKIEVANEAMLQLWGKDQSVIGKTLADALPELEGQPFHQLLDNVFTTGKAYHSDMQSADLVVGGKLQTFWFNFTYKPLHDANGNVYAILNMAVDITKQVQLQQQKDEFLGIASHELKTPVTSIKAYTQVLQQLLKQAELVQEKNMLERMDKQINKLTHLIENLLDVTKIQAGKLDFNERTFDFNQLVKEVVTDMQAIVSTHTIELHEADTAHVFADRERVEQVITNLISNAVKYSPGADKVIVSTEKKDGIIICSVKDQGIGIPKENIENIFDQFYRVNRNNMHRFSGLGLGLYISSEIIRRSNGKMKVDSEEGKGSVFSFELNAMD